MELVDLLAGLQRDGMLGAAVDTNEMSRRFLKGSAR
jgi:hypothetical protein